MCDQAQLPSSHTHWKKTVPICSVFVSGYSAADSQDSRTHGEIKAWQERFRAQNVPCAMQSVSSGCLLALRCCFFLPPPPAPFPAQPHKASFSLQPRLSSFLVQFQLFQDILGVIWGQEAYLFLSLSTLSLQSSLFMLQPRFCSRAFCMCGAARLEAEWMS